MSDTARGHSRPRSQYTCRQDETRRRLRRVGRRDDIPPVFLNGSLFRCRSPDYITPVLRAWPTRLWTNVPQRPSFKTIVIVKLSTLPASSTRSSAIAEGPRDASCQLKSCQLPRNSTETRLLIRQVLTKLMVWSGRLSRGQCVMNNVH